MLRMHTLFNCTSIGHMFNTVFSSLLVQLTQQNFAKSHDLGINAHLCACLVHYIPQLVTSVLRHPSRVIIFKIFNSQVFFCTKPSRLYKAFK